MFCCHFSSGKAITFHFINFLFTVWPHYCEPLFYNIKLKGILKKHKTMNFTHKQIFKKNLMIFRYSQDTPMVTHITIFNALL